MARNHLVEKMKRIINPNWLAENWFQLGGCILTAISLYTGIRSEVTEVKTEMVYMKKDIADIKDILRDNHINVENKAKLKNLYGKTISDAALISN